MKTKLLLSGLALLAATTLVSAQTTATTNEQANAPKKGQFYVDNNNDGVCDNFGSRQGRTARQGKGQGVCNGQGQGLRQGKGNGQGQGKGQGRNFIDANKDGICDNYQSRTKK
jgi:hypothetical protein